MGDLNDGPVSEGKADEIPTEPAKIKANLSSDSGFDETKFMKELINLRETQESIQTLSGWCLKNRKNIYKIARCWLKVVKKVRIEHKLSLVYLINDIVQHAKRKNWQDVLQKLRSALKEAMPHVKDCNICDKVFRVLTIWREREIFDEKFVNQLQMSISDSPGNDGAKKSSYDEEIVDNFQPSQLITQLKILKALEDDTEYKQRMASKTLSSDNHEALFNVATVKERLKDRASGLQHVADFDSNRKHVSDYIKSAERELAKRKNLIDLLNQGCTFYDSLAKEATIVTTAYRNFEQRVVNLDSKLDEHLVHLREVESRGSDLMDSISPVGSLPSPSTNVPSPTNNDKLELILPDEDNTVKSRKKRRRTKRAKPKESFAVFLTRLASGQAGAGDYDGDQQNDLEDINSSSDDSEGLLDRFSRSRQESPVFNNRERCQNDFEERNRAFQQDIPLLSDKPGDGQYAGPLSFLANSNSTLSTLMFDNKTTAAPGFGHHSEYAAEQRTETTFANANSTGFDGFSSSVATAKDDDDLESSLYYSGRKESELSAQKAGEDMDVSDEELEAGQLPPDDVIRPATVLRGETNKHGYQEFQPHVSKASSVIGRIIGSSGQVKPPPPPLPRFIGDQPPPPPPLPIESVQTKAVSEQKFDHKSSFVGHPGARTAAPPPPLPPMEMMQAQPQKADFVHNQPNFMANQSVQPSQFMRGNANISTSPPRFASMTGNSSCPPRYMLGANQSPQFMKGSNLPPPPPLPSQFVQNSNQCQRFIESTNQSPQFIGSPSQPPHFMNDPKQRMFSPPPWRPASGPPRFGTNGAPRFMSPPTRQPHFAPPTMFPNH